MDERGFTLIELLVVVLIIGVLAAIALPTFLGQRDRAHDASAMADARNAVSQMEACFRTAERYVGCPDAEHQLAGATATLIGGGSSYTVSALSDTGTTFTIARLANGYSFTCTQPGAGGCQADSSW